MSSMDFEEITELHNRIAFALRMAGLKRAALDDAIAAAFHDVARAIEDQRAVEWERGKNVRNGFWRLIAKRDVETYTSRTLFATVFSLRRLSARASSPFPGARPHSLVSSYSLLLYLVSESVFRALSTTHVTERHLAASVCILAGAPCDGEHRVALVVERSLDSQLALIQGQRPDALPSLARHDAVTDALVEADLVLVVGIEDLILSEGKDVSGAVSRRAGVGDGLGRVVFVTFNSCGSAADGPAAMR